MVCMNDGRPYGGREKRQRSNSGVGKGVKAVLAIGSKGAGSIIQTPPGGIRAGRPQLVRQAGESPSAPSVWCALAEGFMWAERPGFLSGETSLTGVDFIPCLAAGKFARSSPACGYSLCRAAIWQRALCGLKGPVQLFGIPCPTSREHGPISGSGVRVSSPEAARPKGIPIHHSARGMGVHVRRVVLCAGSIPAGRKSLKGVHTDGF